MLKKTTSDKTVKYKSTPTKDNFAKELRKRINSYFKENEISQYATTEVKFKAFLGFASWGVVYALIMSDLLSSNFLLLMLAFLAIGFINIFLAFNIMHDACHNAYSKSNKTNRLLGYTMNFIGGNSYLFTKMHNAHHAFVNIAGIDVTLETHGLFRFTPHEPWEPKHKWQHIYTPILYSLAMIHWVLVKDYKWMFSEMHIGNQKNIKHPGSEYVILFVSKLFYYGVTLALPLIFISAPWWWVVIAWVNLHILPSLCFALLFQVTHVYNGTHYPLPDDEGNIENNYFIHVLETTADFGRESWFTTWICGGINIHVIHHLFPNINHGHYIPLTRIVKQTAEDFGMQYQENPGFWSALKLHMQMLRKLSKKDADVPQYGPSAALA
ncbi:MAG: acyl-CoA desaturase [Cyclobacteriaceae bacterium]|nr:acyl-CoA desaturase [Cyclobacteriaceae bacterium HetDA_MAG_MS6]